MAKKEFDELIEMIEQWEVSGIVHDMEYLRTVDTKLLEMGEQVAERVIESLEEFLEIIENILSMREE